MDKGGTSGRFGDKRAGKMAGAPERIFLSHKSADKDVVRDYKETLELLGLKPWIDEDDLPAGVELHRALQKGMKESCAAVFFITPAYQDEKFLRAEINHALEEKTQRGDGFSVITLVLAGSGGVGSVPDPLKSYVWKQPKTALAGLRDILQALPAPFGEIGPTAALTVEAKVRVTAAAGHLVSEGPHSESEDVVLVRIENHGSQTLYLTGTVAFERDDIKLLSLVKRDATGAFPTKRVLPPGDGFTIPIPKTHLREAAPHIKSFFFNDEVGRVFRTPEAETRAAVRDIKG